MGLMHRANFFEGKTPDHKRSTERQVITGSVWRLSPATMENIPSSIESNESPEDRAGADHRRWQRGVPFPDGDTGTFPDPDTPPNGSVRSSGNMLALRTDCNPGGIDAGTGRLAPDAASVSRPSIPSVQMVSGPLKGT